MERLTETDVSASGTDSNSGTLSGDRIADVILMFLSNPGSLGVSDVARSLGLSKAVVHRILQSLASRGLVEANSLDQRYRVGRAITDLGFRASYEYDHAWHTAGTSVLNELRDRTGETATLSARIGAMRIFVDQVEGAGTIRLTVALWRPRPLYVGASGKAILAYLDPELRHQVVDHRLRSDGHEWAPTSTALEQELEEVRRSGVALSQAEVNPDAFAVAAPVFRDNQPVGAVGICGPIRRQSEMTAFVSSVRAASDRLSESLQQ